MRIEVYDKVVDIDLNELKPLIACPHSPDKVVAVSELAGMKLDQVCVGSCTNSSLMDMLKVAEILKEQDNILILVHAHPDGDTLGCGFSLCRSLLSLGKNARVSCSDPIPSKYGYLFKDIEEKSFDPDFVVAVDVADKRLLGALEEEFGEKAEPLYPRLEKYVVSLKQNKLIFWELPERERPERNK